MRGKKMTLNTENVIQVMHSFFYLREKQKKKTNLFLVISECVYTIFKSQDSF